MERQIVGPSALQQSEYKNPLDHVSNGPGACPNLIPTKSSPTRQPASHGPARSRIRPPLIKPLQPAKKPAATVTSSEGEGRSCDEYDLRTDDLDIGIEILDVVRDSAISSCCGIPLLNAIYTISLVYSRLRENCTLGLNEYGCLRKRPALRAIPTAACGLLLVVRDFL